MPIDTSLDPENWSSLNIPSLGTLIREQSSLYSFDGSWTHE